MESFKLPLIELHRKLIFQLSEKNLEIAESMSHNKAYGYGLIKNREIEIANFRSSIDRVEQTAPYQEGFQKDYEEISKRIQEIQL